MEQELAVRIAKALQDMPRDHSDDEPLCENVDVDGHTIYVFVDDHQYAIEISDAL